jgi:hypothetical protein
MARSYVTDAPAAVETVPVDTPGRVRRMSWGAALAGVAVVLFIQLLLSLLGVGIGLATVNPGTGDNPSPATFGTNAGIYGAVAVLVATFLGAWASGRLSGSPNRTDGMLHGIVTWSVATLLVIYLLTTTLGSLVGSTFGMLGSTVQSIAQGAQGAAGGLSQVLPDDLRTQVDRLFERGQAAAQGAGQQAQQATGTSGNLDAARRVIAGVRDGASPQDRQAAVNLIAQQAGVPPEEADRRLTEFQNNYRQYVADAKAKATDAAQKAAKGASQAAIWSFVGLLVGLIVAAIGGAVGAPGARRYEA